MKVKINLPHEKGKGFTYALFGKPEIKFKGKTDGSVRVPCHILAAKSESDTPRYLLFESIYPDLPSKIEREMELYAKELAKNFIEPKGWIIKSEGKYIKKLNWYGFNFSIEPMPDKLKL